MSEEFDPYKAWLGIENKSASTTYYKLLGLPEFENNKERIAAAADRMIRQLRSQRPGPHTAEWSKVLDELQEVKASLLDDQKKAAYDDDLRFADEFVKELEVGVKHDPAAAAVAPSAMKSVAPSVKQDPRYPPGMAPKSRMPLADSQPSDDVEFKTSPPPKPVDRKDSPFYPPMRPADKPQPSPPEVTLTTGETSAPTSAEFQETSNPPAAAETSPGPWAAPVMPASQPAPFSSQPPTGLQPVYYPSQGTAPAAGYPHPVQAFPAQPMASAVIPSPGMFPQPVLQQGYPYAAPMAQPVGYGAPQGYGAPMPSTMPYPGTPQPFASPTYGAPMAMPLSPQAYAPGFPAQPYPAQSYPAPNYSVPVPPAPTALDPMAPVAIPGSAVTGGQLANSAPATPLTAVPTSAVGTIPMGRAVSHTPSLENSACESLPGTNLAKDFRDSASSQAIIAKRQQSNQKTLIFVGLAGTLLVAAAIVIGVAASGGFRGLEVALNPPSRPIPDYPAASNPAGPKNSPEPVRPTPSPKPKETPASDPTPVKPPVPKQPDTTAPDPKPETPKTEIPKSETPTPEPPKTEPPKPEPPKPEPPKPEPPKPEPPKPEPPKPEPPKPESPKPEPPPAEMPTSAEAVQLGKLLKQAKSAVGEFNFVEAESDLAKGDKLAKLAEHREKLARLKEVLGYVKQFHERLVMAATAMDGGESFKVGSSTMVAMIEANQKQVVLRVAGQNRTYQYEDLPVGLAAALADMKLDGRDPVSRVLKGAYVAVHKNSTPDQLQQAKSWWEEATLGGADVSHLMLFLSDSYDLEKDLDKVKKGPGTDKPGAETKPDAKSRDPKAILEGKS